MSTLAPTAKVAITGAGATISIGSVPVVINYWETISPSGQKTNTVTVTNASSPTAGTGGLLTSEILPTIIESGTWEMSMVYVPNDPGQAALLAASQNGTLQSFIIQMKPAAGQTVGTSIAFSAFVTSLPVPDLQFDKQASTKATLTVSGGHTITAGTLSTGVTA
jgi:hypothetical protein